MTKKEQASLLRKSLTQLHFHRTITEDAGRESKVVDTLMSFAELLYIAERLEESGAKKEDVTNAYNKAYQSLEEVANGRI